MPMEEPGLQRPLTNSELIWIAGHARVFAGHCVDPTLNNISRHWFISRELYYIFIYFYGAVYADHKMKGCKVDW